jgi:hypothetical protein
MAFNNGTWSYDELDGDSTPRPSVRVSGSSEPAPTTSWRSGPPISVECSSLPVHPGLPTPSFRSYPLASTRERSLLPSPTDRETNQSYGINQATQGLSVECPMFSPPSPRTPLHSSAPSSIPPSESHPIPVSTSDTPNAESGTGKFFVRVDTVMCISKDGTPYLSLPRVFSYVTFGGKLTVKDRIELGRLVQDRMGDSQLHDSWPKVTIDSAWNPTLGSTNEIRIRKYDWCHYPKVASACLEWFDVYKNSVVY